MIAIGDKVTSTADTMVVRCLRSEMKAMFRFQLKVSRNKHVIFPSKFMTHSQEVLLYKFSIGHLLKIKTAKAKMLTANDSQISISNPELSCNLQGWIFNGLLITSTWKSPQKQYCSPQPGPSRLLLCSIIRIRHFLSSLPSYSIQSPSLCHFTSPIAF